MTSGFTLGKTIRKRMALPPLLSRSLSILPQFYRLSNSHSASLTALSTPRLQSPIRIATRKRSQEENQNTGTNEGHKNTAQQTTSCAHAQLAEHPSSDEGADEASNDIPNDPVAHASHHYCGQEASD